MHSPRAKEMSEIKKKSEIMEIVHVVIGSSAERIWSW